jgi:hypothetical protein
MRVRWRQSWGDLFDFLVKDRDLLLLLIIAVLGALIGIAALFGVLTPCAEAARQLLKITPQKWVIPLIFHHMWCGINATVSSLFTADSLCLLHSEKTSHCFPLIERVLAQARSALRSPKTAAIRVLVAAVSSS